MNESSVRGSISNSGSTRHVTTDKQRETVDQRVMLPQINREKQWINVSCYHR